MDYIQIFSPYRTVNIPSQSKTNQSILNSEISVFSQIHIKHIHTLCGQNGELMNVKLVVHIVTTGL